MQRKKTLYNRLFGVLSMITLQDAVDMLHTRIPFQQSGIKEYFDYFEKLNEVLVNLDSFIVISDIRSLRAPYISSAIKDVLGHSSSEIMKGNLNSFLDLVCPVDTKVSLEHFFKIVHHQKSLPIDQKQQYLYSTTLRLYHNEGYYKWFYNHWQFVKHDKKGKPLVSFSVLTDIDQFKPDEQISLIISKHVPEKGTYQVEHHYEDMSACIEPLKPIYIEILKLLSEGHNNAEIAEILKLSEHTIKDYRKKMLKKTYYSNCTELLYYSLRNGILV